MNKTRNDRPRRLMLERLERRSMLAAGIDCGHDADHERGPSDTRRPDRPTELRSDPVDYIRMDHASRRGGGPHHRGRSGRQSIDEPQLSMIIPAPTVVATIGIVLTMDSTSGFHVTPVSRSPPVIPNLVSSQLEPSQSPSVPEPTDDRPTAAEADSAHVEDAIVPAQRQELVSFRRFDPDLQQTLGVNAAQVDSDKSVYQDTTRVIEQVEPLDDWLAEYAKTNADISDLDATLLDLALFQQRSQPSDHRESSSPRLNRKFDQIDPTFAWATDAHHEQMIWLLPMNDYSTNINEKASGKTEYPPNLATGGLGCYRCFDFVDQQQVEMAIDEIEAMLGPTSTLSATSATAAKEAVEHRYRVAAPSSAAYASVVTGIASWQLLRRRKREKTSRSE